MIFNNNLRHPVITDFVQTFERDNPIHFINCRQIVENTQSCFYGFSYLIKHLLLLINSAIPSDTFTIKGLSSSQRKLFYIELSIIYINYSKFRYSDIDQNYTDIVIPTIDIFTIPDLRNTSNLPIYSFRINNFISFYSNMPVFNTNQNGNFEVSLHFFLKFKKIYCEAVTSYNHYMNNQHSVATSLQYNSNNHIKQRLADLIFDIKDNLSDAVYKELLDNIALIS